jgi:hypothetical protein
LRSSKAGGIEHDQRGALLDGAFDEAAAIGGVAG